VYEVNSSVYLPYTLAALFNLYDFAVDTEIKSWALQIIDRIVYHVSLCTTKNGVSNLVAAGRAFLRTRLRTHDHNINQLTNLLNGGVSPDNMKCSALTDHLLTTTWRPNFTALERAQRLDGDHEPLVLSHATGATRQLYADANVEGVPELELVPFYWSAGLITHPDFVKDTKRYQKLKNMTNNESLAALSYMFATPLASIMKDWCTVSMGQAYTGFELKVYKRWAHNLCLSSFIDYNRHKSSFQQLPWMANIAGVGVWAQSGAGSEGFLKFGMTNTHNPVVAQNSNILVATYAA
jgi:hypothetical protein